MLATAKKFKIDFSKASNSRTIKYNGMFINEKRLTIGNNKLSKNMFIFDLPAVKSCLNSKDCASSCYALKAEKQYKYSALFRATNFDMVKNNIELLRSLLIDQLKKSNKKIVRIHSSGDFYNQEYIDMWHDVISMFPNIKFYTYTKVENILNFSEILENSNFNLINSLIDGKLNYGSLDYCNSMVKKYNSFICPATIKSNKKVICGENCNYCVSNKNVVFVQH